VEQKCRLSGEPLEEVIDLGDLCVSDFLPERVPEPAHGRLRIGIGRQSRLLQLMDAMDRPPLYKHYWYRSGTNETMKRQLQGVLNSVFPWVRLRSGDVVLDIGCNDGTLLGLYPSSHKLFRIGIDPAENLAEEARRHCEAHKSGFFTRETFEELSGGRKAKIISSIAMFYGLEDPLEFVSDLRECLADDGIWVLQLSYTPLMIQQNAFDNICHEHIEYYTLKSMLFLLEKSDLKVLDIEFNDTNAGSFRLLVTHGHNKMKDATLFLKDIGDFRVQSTLHYEEMQAFGKPDIYRDYMDRLGQLKDETRELLEDLRAKGKRVMGYGASTKGNTLLQFYGLTTDHIEAIAERQSTKYGLYTAGSWIPIVSEYEMRKMRPDYLLVLPWHFIGEFVSRESEFINRGGKFIVPLPQLQITS